MQSGERNEIRCAERLRTRDRQAQPMSSRLQNVLTRNFRLHPAGGDGERIALSRRSSQRVSRRRTSASRTGNRQTPRPAEDAWNNKSHNGSRLSTLNRGLATVVLAGLAANVDDGAVVGTAKVTDVGAQ
jgi:hypothetical protein